MGAKEEIYDIILDLAEEGMAIMVLSSEAQEVIRLCDRSLGDVPRADSRGSLGNYHERT